MNDNESLYQYVLRLADDGLILGQRLSEWCGHGPVLEEDIALANTSLDYIGQATALYKYAAELQGKGNDEDHLAFVREENEYVNLLMLELPNGDYAQTIARQFYYATYYQLFLDKLAQSSHEFLRGFALKTLKEVRYHVQHATDWILRMGDGTEESHERIQRAANDLWEYTGEFFVSDTLDKRMLAAGIGVDKESLYAEWLKRVDDVLTSATLKSVLSDDYRTHAQQQGGRSGRHTEYMGFLLAEMQYLQRAYPGAKW